MSISVARLYAGLRSSSSRGSGCEPWVGDPALAFYPGTREIARPPETMQSQSRHGCCNTSSVAVAGATLHNTVLQRA
jgi:hypothetical protein